MTFRASRRRVIGAMVGAAAFAAVCVLVPGGSNWMRSVIVVGVALFLVVCVDRLTTSVTTAPHGITVKRFWGSRHFPADDVSVEWSHYFAGVGRSGTAMHLRRRSVKSGMTVLLASYPTPLIESLKKEIGRVTSRS